MKILIAL